MTTRPSFVRSESRGGVRHVQLDRPERLNAVSEELYADLEPALREVAADDGARVLVLSGAGRAFCAGADRKAHAERERSAAERRAYVWAGQRVCRLLQTMPLPVVAAVHGHAIGAGAELALSADVVVCADELQLRFPEVGLGTFVGGGLSQRLPLFTGAMRAKQLLLLGQPLSGAEAVDWGLATEAVPTERVHERAWELAEELAGLSKLSVGLAKRAVHGAGSMSLDEALVLEAEGMLECMDSDEWSSGLANFSGSEARDGGSR